LPRLVLSSTELITADAVVVVVVVGVVVVVVVMVVVVVADAEVVVDGGWLEVDEVLTLVPV
jgi:hypothetical protein